MTPLLGKNILLGITGGIAAYKSAELLRLLKKLGAEVQVVMTKGAQAFVTPLTFQALSGIPVRTELLDPEAEAAMGHIELAKWSDLIVIAPASADFIAKLAGGIADDLLSTLCLATASKIAVAPAMNQQMWSAKSTTDNIKKICSRDILMWGPASGEQACGDTGLGRMEEPSRLVEAIEKLFEVTHKLNGIKVLLTAGPTYEPIDPVRYIGNRSSGKMGYALADAFIAAGAEVTLISGPISNLIREQHKHHQAIQVESAAEMQIEVMARLSEHQVYVGCAAVSDYRVKNPEIQKIKKKSDQLVLTLVRNPDIILEVASSENRPTLVVGFAAETENLEGNAREKLEKKQLDLVCANDVSEESTGFGSDLNKVLLLTKKTSKLLDLTTKTQQAKSIVEKVAELLMK